MQTIFFDFETYYAADYTLRTMTPVEYILDPRFEAIGCAVKTGDAAPVWVEGPDLQAFFDSLDPTVTSAVTFNALFDMCICAWRYNFVPRCMIDMLGVARATLGHELPSLSLAKVALHLKLGVKGDTVHKVMGMGLDAIKASGMYPEYVEYSKHDANLCAGIYDKLIRSGRFPLNEIPIMDMVLRCAIQPQLRLDAFKLAEHYNAVKQHKDTLLAQSMLLGLDGKSTLMSDQRFAEALQELGVMPPTKISAKTGKTAYAFAKTDQAFIELSEHPNIAVQTVVAARLGHKSTLEESRTARLQSIANLTWQGNEQCLAPIPLGYGRAHTHRLGGEWKLNFQNLSRRNPHIPGSGTLRCALIAPPGHKVVLIDSAQIEARLTAWICGEEELVEQFRAGEDVYSSFAEIVFNRPVNKKNNPTERFVGKTGILSLGFGVGHVKFRDSVKVLSKSQTGVSIELTEMQAAHAVNAYRSIYRMIPATWNNLNGNGIPALSYRGGGFEIGPCKFMQNAVLLPSGLQLHYHKLAYSGGEWWFTYGGIPKKLYGGKLLENIVQALARIVVMDAAARLQLRLHAEYGVRLAMQVHDELVYVVPDHLVGAVSTILMEEMTTPPAWAMDLPLAAELGVGQSYGDAK